jgi:hypothetical protein
MRFRLRTLLILLAIGPPVLAVAWRVVKAAGASRSEGIVRYHAGGDIRIAGRANR